MQKYSVVITFTETRTVEVKAETPEEASKKGAKLIHEGGEGVHIDFELFNREVYKEPIEDGDDPILEW